MNDVEKVNVLGIDYSTRSIDFVAIPYDDEGQWLDEASWRSVELHSPSATDKSPARLAILVRERLAGVLGWESIALTYIEQPFSQNRRTLATLSVIEGAIIASLPLPLRRSAVSEISAQEWKRVLCGRPDASKDVVRARVEALGLQSGLPQDACDAAGIAWAARAENRAAVAQARAVATLIGRQASVDP